MANDKALDRKERKCREFCIHFKSNDSPARTGSARGICSDESCRQLLFDLPLVHLRGFLIPRRHKLKEAVVFGFLPGVFCQLLYQIS